MPKHAFRSTKTPKCRARFWCEKCQKGFSWYGEWEDHMRDHEEENKRAENEAQEAAEQIRG